MPARCASGLPGTHIQPPDHAVAPPNTGSFSTTITLRRCQAAVTAAARTASPLIRLAMLRNRVLRASLAMSMLVSTVMMATLVVGPFYLARALGLITGASVMGAIFALATRADDFTTASPGAVALGMRVTFAIAAMLMVLALVIRPSATPGSADTARGMPTHRSPRR